MLKRGVYLKCVSFEKSPTIFVFICSIFGGKFKQYESTNILVTSQITYFKNKKPWILQQRWEFFITILLLISIKTDFLVASIESAIRYVKTMLYKLMSKKKLPIEKSYTLLDQIISSYNST